MRKASAFTFYLLYYAALASLMPFIVLYYRHLGFTGAQIGLLAGMSPLITLVGAPLWTGIADATRRHRLVMSLAIVVAVVLALIFPSLKTLSPVVLLIALYSFFTAPIVSLSDSATMSMLASEKAMYGRVRLGGTIGWGLAAPVAGMLVQTYGLKLAFWGYAVLMCLALIVSQRFVFGLSAAGTSLQGGIRTLLALTVLLLCQRHVVCLMSTQETPVWPTLRRAIGPATSRHTTKTVRALLANRRWVLFLAMAFVGGMGLITINNYLFAYMEELKASETTMGIALTISTLSELPVLFFADRLLKRFKAHGLLVLAMTVTGVRLLLYAAFNFLAGVLVFQILNGLTFPAVVVAGVSYADENAPAGMRATAQGLFGAIFMGFGAAAGGFIGGFLLESIGGRGMYFVFGVIVLVGIAVITLIERRLPAEQHG